MFYLKSFIFIVFHCFIHLTFAKGLFFPRCEKETKVDEPLSPCELAKIGQDVSAPAFREDCFPFWLNETKFVLGQQVFKKIALTLVINGAVGQVSHASYKYGGRILLFTNRNDCPNAAYKRILATVENGVLWNTPILNQEDIWSLFEGVKHFREIHSHVSTRIRQALKKFKSEGYGYTLPFSKSNVQDIYWNAFKKDLEDNFRPEQLKFSSCYIRSHKYHPMNQFELTMVILTLLLPIRSEIGRLQPKVTNEEWESYMHFLRTMAYLFGIEDRFNVAGHSTLTKQKEVIEEMIELYTLPAIYNIDNIGKQAAEEPFNLLAFKEIPWLNFKGGPVSMDAILMAFQRIIFDKPYKNLYKVSTSFGRMSIRAIEYLIDNPNVLDSFNTIFFRAAKPGLDSLGSFAMGEDYSIIKKDKMLSAKYLHYTYDGPVFNPNGIYSNCSNI